jgi:hypothetical protein
MPIRKELNHSFFKKWSSDMAYVLGYFAADGSMVANNRGAHFIEFTSTDRILLEIVSKAAESDHKISARKIKVSHHKQTYRLQIGSGEWFEALTRLGFTQNKSTSLRFPIVPKRYIADFIRGYFDGDGCVHLSTYHPKDRPLGKVVFMTSFTSGSPLFLKELRRLLLQYGLGAGSLFRKMRGWTLSYGRADSVALYRFMYHTSPVSMCLPRKRMVFEKALRVLGYMMRL